MNVKIVARNFDIKKHENDYILEKVENLERFGLNVTNVNVIVKEERYGYNIELRLNALHKNFLIEKKGNKITEVIDIIVDKMAVMLIKHKEKVKNHKVSKINADLSERQLQNESKIIYKNIESLDIMTNNEAVEALINSSETFLAFRDYYTNLLSIAVKKEGTIEIIE